MESCFSATGVQGPQWSGLKSADWLAPQFCAPFSGWGGGCKGVGGEEEGFPEGSRPAGSQECSHSHFSFPSYPATG